MHTCCRLLRARLLLGASLLQLAAHSGARQDWQQLVEGAVWLRCFVCCSRRGALQSQLACQQAREAE